MIQPKTITEKIREYDTLRVLATLLVIVGHCGYYKIATTYGGIDYNSIMSINQVEDTIIHKLVTIAIEFIYSFHMPLFMGLSGALFYKQVKTKRYRTLFELAYIKFERLIVPFVIVSILYVIPIKYLSMYYYSSSNIIRDVFIGQLLLQGNSHLWFLPTLFFCFIAIYIVENNVKKITWYIKLIIYLVLNVVSFKIDTNIINYLFNYLFWFYLGYCFEIKRDNLNRHINTLRYEWVLAVIMIALFFIGRYIISGEIALSRVANKGLDLIVAIIGCYITYIVAYKVSRTKVVDKIVFKEIYFNSFGLYLYSDPLNYLVLFIFYKLFSIQFFGMEYGAFIIFMVRVITTFLGAYVVTKILKKLHIKYLY